MSILSGYLAREALAKWGIDAQRFKTIEECSELSRALARIYNGYDAGNVNVIEELIDVHIMVEQLTAFYERKFPDEYSQMLEKKLENLREMLA